MRNASLLPPLSRLVQVLQVLVLPGSLSSKALDLCASSLLARESTEMIQTGLIPNAHNDLVTDASYDFYGLHLATCSLDQRCISYFHDL